MNYSTYLFKTISSFIEEYLSPSREPLTKDARLSEQLKALNTTLRIANLVKLFAYIYEMPAATRNSNSSIKNFTKTIIFKLYECLRANRLLSDAVFESLIAQEDIQILDEILSKIAEAGLLTHPSISPVLQMIVSFNHLHRQEDLIHLGLKHELIRSGHLEEDFRFFINYRHTASILIVLNFLEKHAILNLEFFSRLKAQDNLPELASVIFGLTFDLNQAQAITCFEMLLNPEIFPHIHAHFPKITFNDCNFGDFEALFQAGNIDTSIEKLNLFFSLDYFDRLGKIDAKTLCNWQIAHVPLDIIPMLQNTPLVAYLPNVLRLIASRSQDNDPYLSFRLLYVNGFISPTTALDEAEKYLRLLLNPPFVYDLNDLIQSSFGRFGIATDKSFASFKKTIHQEETHLALTTLLPSIDLDDELFDELDENFFLCYQYYLARPDNLENRLKLLELIISTDSAHLPEDWVILKRSHVMKILDILLDSQHFSPGMFEKLYQTPNDETFRRALALYADIEEHPQYAIHEYFEMFDLNILNIESFPLIFKLSIQHPNPLTYAGLVTKLIANDLASTPVLNQLASIADLQGLDALFDLLLSVYITTAPHPTDALIKLLQHPDPRALAALIENKFKKETCDLKEKMLFTHLVDLPEIGQFKQILDCLSPDLFQSSELMIALMSYPHQAVMCHALQQLKGKILLKQDVINFLCLYPFPELIPSCSEQTGFASYEDLVLLLNQSALIKISKDNLIPIPEGVFIHEEPFRQLIKALITYEKTHPHMSLNQLDCWPNLKSMHEHGLLNESSIRFILKHPKNQLNALLIPKALLISSAIALAPTTLFDKILSHPSPDLLLETLQKLHAKAKLNTDRFIYLCSETNLHVIAFWGFVIEKTSLADEQLSFIIQKFAEHPDKAQKDLLKTFKLLPVIEDPRLALELYHRLVHLDEMTIVSAYFFFKTEIIQRISKNAEGLGIIFDYFERCGIKRAYHFMNALSDAKIFQLTAQPVLFRELRALLSHKNLDLIIRFSPFTLNLTPGNVQESKNNFFLLRSMPFDNLILFYEHFRTINQAVFGLLMRQNCNLSASLKLIEELVAANLVSEVDEACKLQIIEKALLINFNSFLKFHLAFPLIDSNPAAFKALLNHPKLSDISHLINFYKNLSKVNFSEVPIKLIFEACLEMNSPYDAGYLWWTLYDADLIPAIDFAAFKTICKHQPLLFDLAGSVNTQRELYRRLDKKNAIALFNTFASCPRPDDFGMIKFKLESIQFPNHDLYLAILNRIAKHPHFLGLRDIIHFLHDLKILDVDILERLVNQEDVVNLKHFLNFLYQHKILNKEKILTLLARQDFQQRWRLLGYIRQCAPNIPIELLIKLSLRMNEVKLINQFCVFLDENKLLKLRHLSILLRSEHVIFRHPEVKAKFQAPKDMLLSSINLIQILNIAEENTATPVTGAEIIYHLLQTLELNSRSQQSTHLQSVHESANLSALKLQTRYQHELAKPLFSTAQFQILKEKIEALSKGIVRAGAMRCLERLQAPEYQTAYNTPISVAQLLSLCVYAAQDASNITSSSDDAFLSLIDRLLEIQRGYNDEGEHGRDQSICVAGGFNKLIESLVGIHPDCEQVVISLEAASQKLPRLVVHHTKNFILQRPLPSSQSALTALETELDRISTAGVESIWPMIRERILDELFSEFSLLFRQKDNPDLIAMVDCAIYIDAREFTSMVTELKTHFRKQFAEMPHRLFFHKNDSAENQHRFDQTYGMVVHQPR